jgi:Pyruvate/2-oxoacid:ferredoxin oxidoreductase gamma subunit
MPHPISIPNRKLLAAREASSYPDPSVLKVFRGGFLEHELFISGIGGQGAQLMGKVLALAGIGEGRFVQLTGEYGGAMRGGSTVATVVIGPERLRALPIVSEGSAALVLHQHYFAEQVAPKLRLGSLILADESVASHLPAFPQHRVMTFPGAVTAAELGNPQSGGLVMLGAYAAITGLATLESLISAMKEVVPVYRRQHVEANERALRAGYERAPKLAAPVSLERQAA